jgi:OmpW family
MRIAIVTGALFVSLAWSGAALAQGRPTGFELGLRTGYALPLGPADGSGDNLSDVISGAVPIWIDMGARISPSFYLGGFFQYGVGFVSSTLGSAGCNVSGVSCSMNDLMFGVDTQFHLDPTAQFDPYLGVGVGYEILNFNASGGDQSVSLSFNGFQFANLQAGLDYKPTPELGIGPFVMMSFGEYSSGSEGSISQTAIHEWFTVGFRGAYDLGAATSSRENEPPRASETAGGRNESQGLAADPRPKTTAPPEGAGGFLFGSDSAAASQLCTGAGKAWEDPADGIARCDGTAVDLGFRAASRLKFCDGALCGVTLVVSVEDVDRSEWASQYATIRGALARKYGAPTTRTEDIPAECTHSVPQCLDSGTLTLESQWAWSGGQSIRLAMGRIEGVVRIGIVYRGGAAAVRPKVDGL